MVAQYTLQNYSKTQTNLGYQSNYDSIKFYTNNRSKVIMIQLEATLKGLLSNYLQ